MATFPELIPASRVYTPGSFPNAAFKAYSGIESRVRHSNVILETSLGLTFMGISQAQLLSILSHYNGQIGGFEAFDLPSSIWNGLSAVADFSLTSYRWRYVEPPEVEDIPSGGHNVTLSLVTVAYEGAITIGLIQILAANFTSGAARASNGLTLSIASSFAAGGVTVAADGITATISSTITGGTPSYYPPGVGSSVILSITSEGAATSGGLDLAIASSIQSDPTIAYADFDRTVTASIVGGAATVVMPYFIEYNNFASTAGLNLISTDGVTNNHIYITNAATSSNAGNVWWNTLRAYNSSFTVEWQFECSGGSGADGFCIQWYTNSSTLGGTGGDTGRVKNFNAQHAIQFLTFGTDKFVWWKNNSQQGAQITSPIDFRQDVYYWLDYDHTAQTAKIYASTSSTKPASAAHTFTSFLFDGTQRYMGFGAATGGSTDNHILKMWRAKSL